MQNRSDIQPWWCLASRQDQLSPWHVHVRSGGMPTNHKSSCSHDRLIRWNDQQGWQRHGHFLHLLVPHLPGHILRYHDVSLCLRDIPNGNPTHWNGVLAIWSIRGNDHLARDSSDWVCECWMEVLLGDHHLVHFLHTE